MKKYFVSFSLIVIFAIYIVYQKVDSTALLHNLGSSSGAPTTPTGVSDSANSGGSNMGGMPNDTAKNPMGDQMGGGMMATYKDGTFVGNAVDAYYGMVQVSATISGGKLTDIGFLKYPTDRGHTIEVSNNSLPILKSEAIKIQDSNVDIISGATQTSEGFRASLASALSQAKN